VNNCKNGETSPNNGKDGVIKSNLGVQASLVVVHDNHYIEINSTKKAINLIGGLEHSVLIQIAVSKIHQYLHRQD